MASVTGLDTFDPCHQKVTIAKPTLKKVSHNVALTINMIATKPRTRSVAMNQQTAVLAGYVG